MRHSPNKTEREVTGVRDTVESIWVAIVLAFVLRAFMFEAFVIPTGSMAPRLYGEHWDITCPSCGYEYAYGYISPTGAGPDRGEKRSPDAAICPQCGLPNGEQAYVNGGDRVLVLKYIYNFIQPQPWDVVVFRNPQNNDENYIKRLIGLPGEEIQIINGDIYFRTRGDEPWQIRRKERRKTQDAMWQVVFEQDYPPDPEMLGKANAAPPPRWSPVGPRGEHWKPEGDGGRRFAFDGCLESCELELEADRHVFAPRYGYNPSSTEGGSEVFVCGDLNLSAVFTPKDRSARINLVLTSMNHRFRAELSADGACTLYHQHPDRNGGREEVWDQRRLPGLELGKGYALAFWHVDYRATLWVGDEIAVQSPDDKYSPEPAKLEPLMKRVMDLAEKLGESGRPRRRFGGSGDDNARRAGSHDEVWQELEKLLPTPRARMVAQGGACELSHVSVARDVYYTYQTLQEPAPHRGDRGTLLRYAEQLEEHMSVRGLRSGRPGWGVMGNPIKLAKHPEDPDLDEYFMLGDNSPQSLDSRAWLSAAPTLRLWRKDGRILHEWERGAQPIYTLGTVPRYNLIGRAMFVYWPGGFRAPGLPSLPFVPNVGRMRLIH